MVPHDKRRAEHRHESIAEKLVHRAVMPANDCHGLAPKPVQIIDDRGRRRGFGKCSEIANVEDENADVPQLRLNPAGLGEQLVHYRGRNVLSEHLHDAPTFLRRVERPQNAGADARRDQTCDHPAYQKKNRAHDIADLAFRRLARP